jgi:hypothetical protein
VRRSGRRDWRVGCLRAIRMAPTAAKITSMAIPPTVALPVAAGARCVGRRRDWRRDELGTGRGVGCCSGVTSSRVIAPFPSSSDMLSLTFVLLAAGLPGQSLTVPLDLPAVDTKNARGNYLRPSSRNGNRGRLLRTKGRLNFLTHHASKFARRTTTGCHSKHSECDHRLCLGGQVERAPSNGRERRRPNPTAGH